MLCTGLPTSCRCQKMQLYCFVFRDPVVFKSTYVRDPISVPHVLRLVRALLSVALPHWGEFTVFSTYASEWNKIVFTRVLLERPSCRMATVCRPAHILGGWSPSTPRFPKNAWEIVKIQDFPSNLIDFHGKSMKNRGF